MKVSVIIPLYNHGNFIAAALESCLQLAEVAEVLVIDDGSTDSGKNIVEEFDDSRIRLLTHPGNAHRGTGASRNRGIDAASQDFIAFLDADDVMLPGRFSKTARLFEENPEAGAVYEALENPDGTFTMMKEAVNPEALFFEMEPFGKKGHFSICGLTVRKSAIELAGGFREDLRIGEDTEWIARLVLTSKTYGGSLNRAVARRGVSNFRNKKTVWIRFEKRKMARRFLEWALAQDHSEKVLNRALELFLKYHFEWNSLSNRSAWARKLSELRTLRLLMNPALRNHPWSEYFIRSTLRLPIKESVNYYEPPS